MGFLSFQSVVDRIGVSSTSIDHDDSALRSVAHADTPALGRRCGKYVESPLVRLSRFPLLHLLEVLEHQ
jgi:hypothetical protein